MRACGKYQGPSRLSRRREGGEGVGRRATTTHTHGGRSRDRTTGRVRVHRGAHAATLAARSPASDCCVASRRLAAPRGAARPRAARHAAPPALGARQCEITRWFRATRTYTYVVVYTVGVSPRTFPRASSTSPRRRRCMPPCINPWLVAPSHRLPPPPTASSIMRIFLDLRRMAGRLGAHNPDASVIYGGVPRCDSGQFHARRLISSFNWLPFTLQWLLTFIIY